MYGRGAETTWPCATTAALVIAERASSERKSCSVIQATTVMMTATKQVRNHFTDKHLTIIRLHLAVYFLLLAGESDLKAARRELCRISQVADLTASSLFSQSICSKPSALRAHGAKEAKRKRQSVGTIYNSCGRHHKFARLHRPC